MDTLKFIAIGDPHFKINNIEHSKEMVEKILKFVDEHDELDFIVVLGDVHDKHQYVHTEILTNVGKFFDELRKRKPTYVLVGNHDRRNNSDFLSDVHPFNDLKNKENIYVADKVLDVNIKNHRLLFVPYVPNGRFMEALNTVENPLTASIIFGHQEFYGVPMKAIVSTTGDKWDYNNPWVITGHIHDYWFNKRNIIYPGTPMQHSYGDRNDKTISYFTLYDEKIDTNLYKLEENRIKLGVKTREIVRIAYDKIGLFIPNPNKYQKLIICGTDGQIKAVKQMNYIKELEKLIEKIDYDYITDDTNLDNVIEGNIDYHKPENFLKNLYNTIIEDPRKLRIFEEIFGKLKLE